MSSQNWFIRSVVFVVMVGLGIVAEVTPLHLIFNLQFAFTAVFYLALLQLFGYRQAVTAVLLIHGASGVIESFEWLRFVLALLEVTFVYVLVRYKGKSILTWDLLFWFISWPIVSWTLYSFESFELFTVVLLHGFVNALICVLLAEMLTNLIGRPFRTFFPKLKPLYFGNIITLIIYLAAVLPLYGFTLYVGVFLEDNMLAQVRNDLEMSADRVEERLSNMDADEWLHLQRGSIVQKAYLTGMFDNLTEQSELEILVFNEKGELYTHSGTDQDVNEKLAMLESGYVAEMEDSLFVWLPNRNNSLSDWAKGYYFKSAEFSNLHIFSVMPIQTHLYSNVSMLKRYYQAILLVFLIAVGAAFMCKTIFSRSLSFLTNLTKALPKRMEEEFEHDYQSNIHEFLLVHANLEAVAAKLKQMFQEGKEKNRLLTKRTEQLIESKKKLEYLARYDELTGLLNRRSFHEDITELIAQAAQLGRQFAILFIDIDQFKWVNDRLGHSGGDQLLIKCAERMQSFIKQHDRVNAYRFGGDEFILTIEHTDMQQLRTLIEQLQFEMKQPVELSGSSYTISQSIGISLFPQDGMELDELIRHADQAMYRVKKSGKDGLEFYDRKVDNG